MSSVLRLHEALVAVSTAKDCPRENETGVRRARPNSQAITQPELGPGPKQDEGGGLCGTPATPGDRPDLQDTEPAKAATWPATGKFRQSSVWTSPELDRLVSPEDLDMETYDVVEFRDGFFDAQFLEPRPVDEGVLRQKAESTLPVAFLKHHPLSLRAFFPKQLRDIKRVVVDVSTTRAGIRLAKAFVAFFVAYVLCLVPWVRAWLGRYNYIMVISTIINHPARTVGSQIDGAVLTTLGTATGLGWGAFGLWLSTSTLEAQVGYGGILAMVLFLYIGTIAALRSYFIRLYQFAICSGIAVTYTCLAEVSGQSVQWDKLFDYGVPWVLGQAICLVTCIVLFPDAGARGLATALNNAFAVMMDGLDMRKSQRQLTRRRLAQTFINLSQAYRDMAIDITVTRFKPKDVIALRNLLQAVVRSLLSMKPEPAMYGAKPDYDDPEPEVPKGPSFIQALVHTTVLATPGLSEVRPGPLLQPNEQQERAIRLVRFRLDEPTKVLRQRMTKSLQSCHAVLMDMSGYRRFLGPDESVGTNISGHLVDLRKAMIKFDEAESTLLDGDELATKFVPEVIEIFAYCRPIRQTASSVEAVLVKVNELQQRTPRWPSVHLPSYPWIKALNRTGAQVRHDRGGVTAASYYKSFGEIRKLIRQMRATERRPVGDSPIADPDLEPVLFKTESHPSAKTARAASMASVATSYAVSHMGMGEAKPKAKDRLRHVLWKAVHRLQGFEMRFALKNAIVTSLLAIPAWLDGSRGWWNDYEAWWAVVMAWLMMHPRVGGNFQDLVTRAFMAVLGAVWGGAAYAAGNGNPYVMAAFAIVFMVPMLYRFTQSSHPRSGMVACIAFSVSSLALVTDEGRSSTMAMAISRGVAFMVGVVAAVVINWIIWPFVARHELRKALSLMMYFMSITYRSIIGRYVYYDPGHPPTREDIQRSEILEGRLREGFVRVRQLMGLTRHEIRLRAPFDALPYSALADSCERFFEFLVAVRQSALFFHPQFIRDNDEAVERLLSYRRDAVAAVLTNLYIFAGALRSDTKVPKYLPSAAAARKRLTDKMGELEAEYEDDRRRDEPQLGERKKWVQVYSYSYNESLTGCVAQLEELERYTKMIVGEHGFDDAFDDEDGSDEEKESHGSGRGERLTVRYM